MEPNDTEDSTVLADSRESPNTMYDHTDMVRVLEQVEKDMAALDRTNLDTPKLKTLISNFGCFVTCSIIDQYRAYTQVVSSLYNYPRDLVHFFRYWICGGRSTWVIYFSTENHIVVTNEEWLLSQESQEMQVLSPDNKTFGPAFPMVKTVYRDGRLGPPWIATSMPMDSFLLNMKIKPDQYQTHIPEMIGLQRIETDHTLARLRQTHLYRTNTPH